MQIKSAQELHDLAIAIFKAAGATAENAEGVTSSLISANLVGHDSHGVMRIPSYIEDIQNGRIRPTATPFITQEKPAAAIVDCAATFGQLGARLTAQTAVAKARKVGMGGAALYRANHTGRIGEWAELGASQGMITLATASGPFVRLVAPFRRQRQIPRHQPDRLGRAAAGRQAAHPARLCHQRRGPGEADGGPGQA